jgi:hypothetical protein
VVVLGAGGAVVGGVTVSRVRRVVAVVSEGRVAGGSGTVVGGAGALMAGGSLVAAVVTGLDAAAVVRVTAAVPDVGAVAGVADGAGAAVVGVAGVVDVDDVAAVVGVDVAAMVLGTGRVDAVTVDDGWGGAAERTSTEASWWRMNSAETAITAATIVTGIPTFMRAERDATGRRGGRGGAFGRGAGRAATGDLVVTRSRTATADAPFAAAVPARPTSGAGSSTMWSSSSCGEAANKSSRTNISGSSSIAWSKRPSGSGSIAAIVGCGWASFPSLLRSPGDPSSTISGGATPADASAPKRSSGSCRSAPSASVVGGTASPPSSAALQSMLRGWCGWLACCASCSGDAS